MMGGGMNFGPSFAPNQFNPVNQGNMGQQIPFGPISMNRPMPNIGRPTPDAQGYYGGYQTEGGLNMPGNRPGMGYML